jgi:hypothetical protein
MPKKNKKSENPNTLKSQRRYERLDRIARILIPVGPDERLPTFSDVGTRFTQAMLSAPPTPETLTDDQLREIVRGVLAEFVEQVWLSHHKPLRPLTGK